MLLPFVWEVDISVPPEWAINVFQNKYNFKINNPFNKHINAIT